jgi:hypothetical protein
MTVKTVAAGLAGLVLGAAALSAVTPVLAEVSEAARKACETKADTHQPALNAVDREAFIANCLADASTGE